VVTRAGRLDHDRPPSCVPCPWCPGTLCLQFDDLFGKRSQREAFRRCLEGLLLPAERNKTLTALANAEPVIGARQPAVQALQWFLSESTWDAEAVTTRRVAVLRADSATAPDGAGGRPRPPSATSAPSSPSPPRSRATALP
jgi:hypothetical protein